VQLSSKGKLVDIVMVERDVQQTLGKRRTGV
jgi:hypothetical protein